MNFLEKQSKHFILRLVLPFIPIFSQPSAQERKGFPLLSGLEKLGQCYYERFYFSDHLNYWDFGFSALMLTDTSFFRNKNYHQSTDTRETLDIGRMAKVIDGAWCTLLTL